MALNAQQRATVETRLASNRVDGVPDETLQVTFKRRELAFVLEAIASYRDGHCVSEEHNADCRLLYWYETPEGHLERGCEQFCEQLIDRLVEQVPETISP